MMSYSIFKQFRENLQVQHSEAISTSYKNITKCLNTYFWSLESNELAHSLQVGSYGRNTAIRNVSDLDMVFELPNGLYEQYDDYESNGQSQLLQSVKTALLGTYPKTKIKGDGQVVIIEFDKYRVEVLPCFLQADRSYIHPDSNNGGSWGLCNPRLEISELDAANIRSNRNLKHVCKMLRAWKDKNGAPLSGYLLDTLVYHFFEENTSFNNESYGKYPELLVSIFSYLCEQEADKEYWLAPGSMTKITSTGNFRRKAKKAAQKCIEALNEESESKKIKLWKEIFGRHFPNNSTNTSLAKNDGFTQDSYSSIKSSRGTEEFIESLYPVEITYDLDLECHVKYSGVSENSYRSLERIFLWLQLNRDLQFNVLFCNVPEPYEVHWKVRNVGRYAERSNKIRGEICRGSRSKTERTSFGGAHYVECYIIKDNVCVARDLIEVPILQD